MRIEVVKGVGSGKTSKSAFDAALHDAGISNYNLICLSSIIPQESSVKIIHKRELFENEYGNILYVILAKMEQVEIGKHANAGLGWAQQKDGRGVFVEHYAESEDDVKKLINLSLGELVKRRKGEFGEFDHLTASIECKECPVCALVVALYSSQEL